MGEYSTNFLLVHHAFSLFKDLMLFFPYFLTFKIKLFKKK